MRLVCEDMMRECRVLEDCPHRYVNVHPLPATRGRPDPLGVRGVSTCADRAEGIVNLGREIYSREAHVGQDGGCLCYLRRRPLTSLENRRQRDFLP